jgi:hypothetical protein
MMIMVNSVLLLVFTIFSLVSFGGVLWGADPYTTTTIVKSLFFVTLFLSVSGAFSLLNLWMAKLFRKPTSLDVCLRRGLLLGLLAVAIVSLETAGLLNFLNAFALLTLVVALEIVAIYRRQYARSRID